MERKYILTDETKVIDGHTLHRIKAIRDFGGVCKDELGGFIETENNLSHNDNAWVADAMVFGNAKVYGNAWVYGNAKVYGNALVFDNAKVCGNAKVCDNAWVYGDAKVYGNAWVYGDAEVYGNAWVYGDACVYGDVEVCNNVFVYGNAKVFGNVWVYGNAKVCGDAQVSSMADYMVFKNWWSSGRYFTWTRSNDKWRVGCFYGTGEELIAKAYKDSETSGREYQRVVEYVESTKKNVI